MKQGLFAADWPWAVLICCLVALAAWTGLPQLQSLERDMYDLGVASSSRQASDKVAVIAIDNESIANLGRWPWPRDLHASLITKLQEGGAKVIGHTVLFSEPQQDPGLQYIELLDTALKEKQIEDPEIKGIIEQAVQTLDTDGALAGAMQNAGSVVLGMTFEPGEPRGNPDGPLPQYIGRNMIPNVQDRIDAEFNNFLPISVIAPQTPPIPAIGEQSLAIGHLSPVQDIDGGIRTEPLALRYYNEFFPSFALQVAARSLNLTEKDITIQLGEGIRLGRLNIETDPFLLMNTFYYADQGNSPAFSVDSFFDVLEGKVPASKYADKIVLIGATATGVGTVNVTPVDSQTPPVLVAAHTVSSILNEDFFVTPEWAPIAQVVIFVLCSIYLVFLFPRLSAGVAAAISLALVVLLLGAHYFLMTSQGMWIQLVFAAVLIALGHILLTTKRFLVTERGKLKSDAESAETNRMLGLAYQGKGDLDAAFASFRRVRPVDESVLDLLYNLALDFERKRQFNKATSVYAYISENDPDFRDIKQRLNRSKAMEDTVMLGTSGSSSLGGTLLLDGASVEKPMLGRYQVEKELGKGAMGVVYLGRDPKINRVVAIKTMALSQEFEEDELDDVKERFFREAETAGRLNHPNIVTIFDAGEEHDLAYIAMEFLKGKDLTAYTKPDVLLPMPTVLDLVIKSAEALDYAHGENVVHRDIKPANIMYEAESNTVKLTDFGIARITDSSKTKTGMVLGTPSYMSPEQLSGKRVDGRSDLFSLGVMLYQMCSGKLPFTGDSMATLMYKIANEDPPDISTVRPDLPRCVCEVIDKAMKKNVHERYSRGAEMARDLRACVERLAA